MGRVSLFLLFATVLSWACDEPARLVGPDPPGITAQSGIDFPAGDLEVVVEYGGASPVGTGARYGFEVRFVDPANPCNTVRQLGSVASSGFSPDSGPPRPARLVITGIPPGGYRLALFYQGGFAAGPGCPNLLLPAVDVAIQAGVTTTHTFEVSGEVGVVVGTITINGQPPGFGFELSASIEEGRRGTLFSSLPPDGGFRLLLPDGPGRGEVRSFAAGILGSFDFAVLAGQTVVLGEPLGNTQAGSDVQVAPFNPDGTIASDATLTFSTVLTPGNTRISRSDAGPVPPDEFKLGDPPTYYDIITTAVFSGSVTVCIDYTGVQFGNEEELRLFHGELDPVTGERVWEDRTVSVDPANNIICAEVSSLSLFAIVEPANHPPTANAGPDQSVECAATAGTPVTLDGSMSFDPDDDPLSYEWFRGGTLLATGARATATLALGVHPVTLRVTDDHGATGEDEILVTVKDTHAPSIQLVVSPAELWPPNHEMRLVASGISATDACDPAPSLAVTVTSNEPVDGLGDGDTAPDWQIVARGDGTFDVFVRAERSGIGTGRVYPITATARDASGTTATASATVTVPHDFGR